MTNPDNLSRKTNPILVNHTGKVNVGRPGGQPITTSTILLEADSGKQFILQPSSQITITIPRASPGLLFRFVSSVNLTNAVIIKPSQSSIHGYAITATNIVTTNTNPTSFITLNGINQNNIVVGDWVELIGTADNVYAFTGFGANQGSISFVNN